MYTYVPQLFCTWRCDFLLFHFLHHSASLSPSVPYGRLEQFTELMVSPKMRSGDQATSLGSGFLNSSQSPHTAHQASDQPASSISSLGIETHECPNNQLDVSQSRLNHHQQQQQQWGGIADFKSLLKYVITGGLDPAKEPPPVPSIPATFGDCVLRVCRTPPRFATHLGAIYGEVHMLPLAHHEVRHLSSRQPAITYGKLSKVASPKEARERAKQAMERRKSEAIVSADEENQKAEEVLVRVKCHLGDLDEDHADFQRGELHSGRLWVSR